MCSSCYLMNRQASLSLWISRPASRRRTEEEEVLNSLLHFSTVGKHAQRISHSRQNALNPTLMNINEQNFFATPIDNFFRRLWINKISACREIKKYFVALSTHDAYHFHQVEHGSAGFGQKCTQSS